MTRGSIRIDDAKLIMEFARAAKPTLEHSKCFKLLEAAKTVERIAFCAYSEARMHQAAENQYLTFMSR